jgi:hypothetical protein
MWNWAKASLYDDVLFVSSCICHGIGDEIQWPTLQERIVLAQKLSKLLKCIEFIDGTIIKICQPWNVKHIKFGSMVKKKKL